jgi:hypothetical protein
MTFQTNGGAGATVYYVTDTMGVLSVHFSVVGQLIGFHHNPKRKRGPITEALAYASGYDRLRFRFQRIS